MFYIYREADGALVSSTADGAAVPKDLAERGLAVVELDRRLGEAVDIYVNNRLVARGEVVMVDDNRLGITMTEIVKSDRGG